MNHRARARYGLPNRPSGGLRGLGGDTPEYGWQHSRAQALDKAVCNFIVNLPGGEYVKEEPASERCVQAWWVIEDFKKHGQTPPPLAKTREEAIAYLELQEGINRQAAKMPGAQSKNDLGAADRSRRFADALRAEIAAEKQKAEEDADARAVADAKAKALAAETAKISNDVAWLTQQARAMEYLAYPAAPTFFAQDAASNPGSGAVPRDIADAFAAHGQKVPAPTAPKDFDTALVYAQTAVALLQRALSIVGATKGLAIAKALRRTNDLRAYLNTMLVVQQETGVISANLAVKDAALQREKDANVAADKARREADAAKASGDAKAAADAEAAAKAAADEVKKAHADRFKTADELAVKQKELEAQLSQQRLQAEADQKALIEAGRDAASKATEETRKAAAQAIAEAQARAEAQVTEMRAAQARAEAAAAQAAADLAKARVAFEGATQLEKDRAARAEAAAAEAAAKADAAEKKAADAQAKLPPQEQTPPPPSAPLRAPEEHAAFVVPWWAIAGGGVAVLGLALLLWPSRKAARAAP